MSIKEQIDAVVVNLEVKGQPCLLVLLSEDGTTNRLGTGAADNAEKALFVGPAPGALFQRFMAQVEESLFEKAGLFKHPDPQGDPCKLSLAFRRPGKSIGFEFHFGTEGEGPPGEIAALVKLATELTDNWYQTEKQRVAAEADPPEEDA